jgi:hypothetical protein
MTGVMLQLLGDMVSSLQIPDFYYLESLGGEEKEEIYQTKSFWVKQYGNLPWW